MKGRKPTPTPLKLLNGNPGKRPINKNEPKPPVGAPECPTWLSREAKAEWRRVVPALDRLHMLAKVDRAALAAYCAAWASFMAAEQNIARNGQVFTVPDKEYVNDAGETVLIVRHTKNPAVLIARDSAAQLRQFCSEFGLTPSSRSRMELPGAGGGDSADGERYLS